MDCGALPAPHPTGMGSTELRGTIMIPSRVHLDFPEIFRLYSLGIFYTVWEWLYSFMGVGPKLFGGVADKIEKRRQDVVRHSMDAQGCPEGIFETTK